jgi:hypothetical protein
MLGLRATDREAILVVKMNSVFLFDLHRHASYLWDIPRFDPKQEPIQGKF